MSQESITNDIEKKESGLEKQEAINFLKENGTEIGGDVKQYGTLQGISFGADYKNSEYATNNGWANFKHDNTMRAIFITPSVAKKIEEAGFQKISAGVIDNNPDRFHAGFESSAFKEMAAQVGTARRLEKNADEKYLSKEDFSAKYGEKKS